MCSRDERGGPAMDRSSTDPKACDTVDVSFSADIQPGLQGSCAYSGCHDAGTQANGIVLETHDQITDVVENEPFLCAIKHRDGCSNMPVNAPQLPKSAIQEIECWIDEGMPEN